MLDGLVSEILSRVLGNYIDGIDSQNVQLGMRRGKISLENLRLSRNIFHNFGVPFDVEHGLIKHLEIEIPWSDLLSKPSRIQISDVYILALPHPHKSGVCSSTYYFLYLMKCSGMINNPTERNRSRNKKNYKNSKIQSELVAQEKNTHQA